MSYWIPARELYIAWGNDTSYWRWISLPPPQVEEVAELVEVCWLEIRGRVELKKLLLKTSYSAYLVLKLNSKCYGLRKAMAEVGVGDKGEKICFVEGGDWGCSTSVFIDREKLPGEGGGGFRQPRGKGWMEIKLGDFFNNLEGDKDAEAALFGLQQNQWKSGLIVKGIHFRPNYY